MEFRLARPQDLPQLTAVYQKIIAQMAQNGVDIWDEVYPCALFDSDIAQKRLSILVDGPDIAAAFALCAANDGAAFIQWAQPQAKALYLDRLGVSPAYSRQGLGGEMLRRAAALAKEAGAAYLRLFVVDCNLPAIRLYRKSGFLQMPGCYEEQIDDELVLREWGFERKL